MGRGGGLLGEKGVTWNPEAWLSFGGVPPVVCPPPDPYAAASKKLEHLN